MNSTVASRADGAAFPIPKLLIVVLAVVAPLWGGTIMYYLWKDTYPAAARLANRVSWAVLGVFLATAFVAGVVAGARGHR